MPETDRDAIQVAEAYQHCMTIARQHYENFPTASHLIHSDLRPAVAAIYAFARHADDLADEGSAPADMRLKQLDAWETLLERCEKNPHIDHVVFRALGDAIRSKNLPIEELYNLLIAFRMDVTLHAYSSKSELLFYCKHSANPVGRLMLALHGIQDAEAFRFSDRICTALQLINFWQDLSIDLPKGRCYLPAEWLSEHQISADQLLHAEVANEQFLPVFHQALSHTRAILLQGIALLPRLPMRLRIQIAATIHAGLLILYRLNQLDQPLTQRISITKHDWLTLALPILRDSLFPTRAVKRSQHDA
ncbi:MAG: squalene synthase HpnC [Mariprofundus sp.]|nr:squalene synthase HpnC [Mariprofundus sp.]